MSHINNIMFIEKYLSEHGYVVEHREVGPPPHSLFCFVTTPTGKSWITLCAVPTLPFQTRSSADIRANKLRSYAFAEMAGMRVPATISVHPGRYKDGKAMSMLQRHRKLIVKPYDSCQSRGLTTDIYDLEAVKSAIARAGEVSETVLIQEQVEGEELRMISVDGRIRAVLLRQKPQVIGDGTSTIAQLIERENIERTQIYGSIVAYPQLDESILPTELLMSGRVPAAGEVVKLSNKTMIRGGASVYNVITTVDPSYIAIVEKATMQFGEGVTCVDLMIKDFTAPANDSNYAFIEFNGNPSIAMCYSCRDGKHFAIMEEYLGPKLLRALP